MGRFQKTYICNHFGGFGKADALLGPPILQYHTKKALDGSLGCNHPPSYATTSPVSSAGRYASIWKGSPPRPAIL